MGAFAKKKPCIRLRRLSGLFIFIPHLSKLSSVYKQKSPSLSRQGFFFVDKRFEISNHDLVRDMVEIVELTEVLS
jgi:hypothetical protein